MTLRSRPVRAGAALIGLALLLAACSSGVSSEALAQVSKGMKVGQVESLLGRPTRIDESEITDMGGIIGGKVYHYTSTRGDARVIFINDTVFKTEFVPEGKEA